jgi:BirA family biotin operon repressor/biotin-[acetyl-CoA-carboxylase] ligase
MPSSSFNLARLRSGIKPFRLHWFSRLRSTNDHATFLRKRGELFAPAIVLTGKQTAGRGRNANTWWSGTGSLTVTFVLPIDEHRLPHQLPLIAGLAVRDAAAQLSGDEKIQLKWPNDIVWRGRKLAGLLCERVHKADLVGLGLNINATAKVPKTLRNQIVTLSEITGRNLDKTEVLIALANALHRMTARRGNHPFPAVLRAYDEHHALVGKNITIYGAQSEPPIHGICRGMDSIGRMLVESRGRTHRIVAGHVVMR